LLVHAQPHLDVPVHASDSKVLLSLSDTVDRTLALDVGLMNDLERLTARKFSCGVVMTDFSAHKSCSNPAGNMCSDLDVFRSSDLRSQHVLLCPLPTDAKAAWSRYVQCKAEAPDTTSACLILPVGVARSSSWRKLLKNLDCVLRCGAGTPQFLTSQDGGCQPLMSAHPFECWYDRPDPILKCCSLQNDMPVDMMYTGSVWHGCPHFV